MAQYALDHGPVHMKLIFTVEKLTDWIYFDDNIFRFFWSKHLVLQNMLVRNETWNTIIVYQKTSSYFDFIMNVHFCNYYVCRSVFRYIK